MESEILTINQEHFDSLQKNMGFQITPCDKMLDLDDPNRYEKMELTSAQKMHISAMLQNAPLATSALELTNAYTVSFPEGLPHTLTALKQGGYGSQIRVDGKFAGSASFYEMSAQAVTLGAFTAMSVATGQYFMSQINSELKMINQKMDKILEFLYGDKKAELMSEISFVQYAYGNYASIMEHDTQRAATIGSLQEAKKVAMKDIEFYLGDLSAQVSEEAKGFAALESLIQNSYRIKGSLDLSMQLYIMSSLLEMQFAQNFDKGYINFLETEMISYVDKCDKRILADFGSLKGRLESYKAKPIEKIDKEPDESKIGELINSLNSGTESETRKTIRRVLHAQEKESSYLVNKEGNVYVLKRA